MLLGRGTLASLSCYCNTITHLQLSWTPRMSSVPSLGDLPPTNGERRDVPPDLALAGRPPPGQLLTHLRIPGKDAPHALCPGCQT